MDREKKLARLLASAKEELAQAETKSTARDTLAREELEHTRKAGSYLARAKKIVGHRNWLPWLRENFHREMKTAQNAKRIAQNWQRLQPYLEKTPSLSKDAAMKILRTQDKKQKELHNLDVKAPGSGPRTQAEERLRTQSFGIWAEWSLDEMPLTTRWQAAFLDEFRQARQEHQAAEHTIIFHSGTGCNRSNPEIVFPGNANIMPSFHDFERELTPRRKMDDVHRCFLDSGAFGLKRKAEAYAQEHGSPWGLYEEPWFFQYMDSYADFVHRNRSVIDLYANMDAIGNPEQTYRNQQYLEHRHRLRPVPVVHFGSDLEWLERYIEDGHELIGLGNLVRNSSKPECSAWLDRCFELAGDRVKLHGFGMTGIKVILDRPWYSVDSVSWAKGAGAGMVCIPKRVNGEFALNKPPRWTTLSEETPDRDNHYDNLSPRRQRAIRDWLELIDAQFGSKGREGVTTSYVQRRIANLRYFDRLQAALRYPRFQPAVPSSSAAYDTHEHA